MSRRILSRPRTRVYNSNYDIGESYYKSALDRLDRKYSGRAASPPPRTAPTLPEDLLQRHEQAFADDDLPSARRRAEDLITGENLFDSRGARAKLSRPLSTAFDAEDEIGEEISSTLRKYRAKKNAAKVMNDLDLDSTIDKLSFNRMINKTDKMLDAVGLNEKTARSILEDEPAVSRRRMLRITSDETVENKDLTKWSSLKDVEDDTRESAASFRAKQSRARLHDLEDEMEALAERQAARERRAANLRAIVAENAEESQAMQTAMKSARVNMRSEKKTVTF